ncbi:MAG: hypothetical protein CH6_1361 [Candidatus Kapaibacterium sp.]|nr:MAG: hypothetical protein CH6_1361 [Candidatus Kapabacteria bacterium]
MLQTQKYSPEFVEKVITEIEKSTSELYQLLTSEGEYSDKIEKVQEILDKRDPFFKEFEKLPSISSLELYFRNNHNKWLNRIKKILEQEKINLDIIEKSMKLQSEKVKDLNKQKRLMIYMKGEL